MKYFYFRFFLLCAFFLVFNSTSYSQFVVSWQDRFGGSNNDWESKIINTSEEGNLMFGSSNSNDNDVSNNHGSYDFWIVETNLLGGINWTKSFGGSGNDYAKCAVETADGCYIVAGTSESADGDISQNQGLFDVWVIKLSPDGALLWQFSYGGSGDDEAVDIRNTTDGNFIILGNTTSVDGDVLQNNGMSDFWLIKLDTSGNMIWQKTYGGSFDDFASSVIETVDGGFMIAGSAISNDGDIETHYGAISNSDYFIIKTDDLGNKQWVKNYGGNFTDMLAQIIQTSDGGYLMCGFSDSDNGDVSGNHGSYDAWLIKINQTGGVQWQKSVGGSDEDIAKSIIEDYNGNYLLSCTTSSNDGQVSGNHGSKDIWIVSLSNSGPLIWQECFGGSGIDEAGVLITDQYFRLFISGYSNSTDGNLPVSMGDFDFWLMHFYLPAAVIDDYSGSAGFAIYPNPCTSGSISFYAPDLINNFTKAEILSANGSVVFSSGKIDFESESIDVSFLSKGIYLLRLEVNNTFVSQKFLVQ